MSVPFFPVRFEPSPWAPRPAAKIFWKREFRSVLRLALATRYTEPPGPPSPPLGPPRGTNFSRLNAMAPRPPCPAATWMSTSSTNTTGTRGQPGALRTSPALALQRNDADHASAGAVILELDRPVAFRKQRSGPAEAD